jgi:hypothetical protein
MMMGYNPFIYGRSLKSSEFVGRRKEIRTIFSRLLNGESTAVIGEPHSGKTSLIHYVASDSTRHTWLKGDSDRYFFVVLDGHSIPAGFTPKDFWREALKPLESLSINQEVRIQLKEVQRKNYEPHALGFLFDLLSDFDFCLVVLIDEFEILLHHSNFNNTEFFGCLRSWSTTKGSLCLIVASRLSLSDLNGYASEINPHGSPFFNNFAAVNLGALREKDIVRLLSRAVEKSGMVFDDRDYAYLIATGGKHPYCYQVAGSALFDAIVDGLVGDTRYQLASETFYERVVQHFDEVWGNLHDRTRTVLIMLSLIETCGAAGGQVFSFGEIEQIPRFRSELRLLERAGLAEKIGDGWQFDSEHLLLWQGERWRLASKGLVWWASDVVISQSREVKKYDEWLQAQRYRGLLTTAQWDKVKGLVAHVPISISGLVTTFVSELLKIPIKEV